MSKRPALRHGPAPAIRRDRPLEFSFDGRACCGYEGDTIASALLASGPRIIARSFKLRRPRGIYAAGIEDPNALVSVNGEPNVRATDTALTQSMIVRSQRGWPSAERDVGSMIGGLSRLLPAGFYHKTFMWPHWRFYENAIRHAAASGRVGSHDERDYYVKRFRHCDVLVIGAGTAGISAALSAAHAGADVVLIDADSQPGGSLLWSVAADDRESVMRWLHDRLVELQSHRDVLVLPATRAEGYYDDNFLTAVERLSHATGPRQRLWKFRAAQVVLATGASERPLVFPNNDRPGVMLAAAVRQYANRYGVLPGSKPVIFTNNDSAYHCALDLLQLECKPAVVDVRAVAASDLRQRLISQGVPVYAGSAVINVHGGRRVEAVEIAECHDAGLGPASARRLPADLLAVSGGWDPLVHLYSQAGGSLRFDDGSCSFVPAECAQSVVSAGACNGCFDLAGAVVEGARAGSHAARAIGLAPVENCVPVPGSIHDSRAVSALKPWWHTPAYANIDRSTQQWIDLHHDVSLADVALATREGFESVEHLKRYTTIGMAPDQGKTSNVNALAVLGQLTDRVPGQVGTTKYRPPFHPLTLAAIAGSSVDGLSHRYRRLPVSSHEALGAVLEDHSGWLRPAYYQRPGESETAAIRREALAARTSAVLFDSSSLGKIEVAGNDAAELLNRLYVNNVKTLSVGRARYGMMLDDNGVIIDDGVFARLADNHYLIATSSAGALDIQFWIERWLQCEWSSLDVLVTPQTSQWATLTVSGPRSRAIVSRLGLALDLSSDAFGHMELRQSMLEGVPLRILRVSFSGELSYELNVPADHAESLWQLLLRVGASDGLTPLGMEALDVLRVEKGYLEAGVDTDGETTPLDVGWAAAIARKPDDFLGRRSLSRNANRREQRRQLVGLRMNDANRLAPAGTHLFSSRGELLGHVTSSCVSPTLDQSIGLALVHGGQQRLGESIHADIGGRRFDGQLVDAAFYDPAGERLRA